MKCYATYFTPEVFYQLAVVAEKSSEPILVMQRIERFILFEQLPLKYVCLIVGVLLCSDIDSILVP